MDVPGGVKRFLRDSPTGLLDGVSYPKTVTAWKFFNRTKPTQVGGFSLLR